MPTESLYDINPFESPIKTTATSTPQSDILVTADRLLEQLKDLENLCSTVEERVQRKRQALKELEYLILGSNAVDESPCSPNCPVNTPIGPRLHLVSPRLRGLFDLHGPGQVNLDAIQTCLDYSPEIQTEGTDFTHEELGQSDGWEDDDEEALLCPFDDRYALWKSPRKVTKPLPAIPREKVSEVVESRIPKKVHVRRQVSASKKLTCRPSGAMMRSPPKQYRPSVCNVKPMYPGSDLAKGTTRQGSRKRSVTENVKSRGGTKVSPAIENECAKEGVRKRGKRKGLWSIYSVCSELGLSGTHTA